MGATFNKRGETMEKSVVIIMVIGGIAAFVISFMTQAGQFA